MKLLWHVGIEGSGHFMLRDVLGEFLALPSVVDKGPHYPLWLQGWDASRQPLPRPAVRRELERILRGYRDAAIDTIFEDTSFPFGGVPPEYSAFASDGSHRGPCRRPDILEMMELMGDLAEVKILVAYRAPAATVASALRRGFSNNPHFECKLAEAIHLAISGQLRQLPANAWRTYRFEEFLRRPREHASALAGWWGIPLPVVENGLERLRKPSGPEDVPQGRRGALEEFFTEQRILQWIDAYESNPLLPS